MLTPERAMRVLLVEDNELDARMMTKSLTGATERAFAITRAADLATAQQMLEDGSFDCVLLDLSLPDSAGLVSVEVLSTRFPDCPIVVLTGLDDPSTAVEAVEQGAQDYLSKQSADPETVARSVRYAVARQYAESALVTATEQLGLMQDRERIARDLHDTVIQQLFGTGLGLQSVAALITDPEIQDRVRTAVSGIDSAIAQLREAIFGLHAIPDNLAVAQSVAALADERAEALGFEPIVEVGQLPDKLPSDIHHEVIQVVGEALSKVARHADASAATVLVTSDRAWLTVVVSDNGKGVIDRPTLPGQSLTGRGLANMERRAQDLSGSFRVGPGSGGGTRIEWRVPLASSAG